VGVIKDQHRKRKKEFLNNMQGLLQQPLLII